MSATAGPAPITGAKLALVALALAIGTFMQVLDGTIANVSLPTIAGNLGASADSATWVITSFAAANAIGVPLTGWLMGRFGVVRTFVVSVVLFTIASLLCGIAWDLPSLIGFRALQGAVSGPMIPGSQALLISVFPPHKRGTALAIWVAALQIMLDLGKNDDWFHSTRIVVLAIVAVVGFVFWLIWELTDANPTVDLSLFRFRNFALGTIAFCLGYAVFFANNLLLPLWLQTNLGYTATWAGLVAAPSGLVAVLLTPFVARLGTKVDARWMATTAFAFFALSYWLRSEYVTEASYWAFTVPVLISGISSATFFLAMVTISLDGVPADRLPSATGISNFARICGGSFAASIVTTAWDRREALHQSRLAEAVGNGAAYQHASGILQGMGLNDVQAAGLVTRQLVGQAYLLASDELFRLSAWICIGLIALVWLTRRPTPLKGPVAAD
jgi:predicted MFS family arabinose efflux permease